MTWDHRAAWQKLCQVIVAFFIAGMALMMLESTRAPQPVLPGVAALRLPETAHSLISPVNEAQLEPQITATGAHFDVTWSAADCVTPPAGAVTALNVAAALWGTWISSTVPIAVSACWTPNLNCGGDALACGGPTAYAANFPDAPLVNVKYPAALANALSDADLDPTRGDIVLRFKSDAAWSFATAAHTTANEDFVTVALHELAHGLGFIGNMYEDYSVGFCGDGPYGSLYPCPTPYDWFAVDSSGIPLLHHLTPDPRELGKRLKSDTNFGGPNVVAVEGGAVKLYTPPTFLWGSSLSHLDQTTFQLGENRLMTPSYSGVVRHPGPLTLAMLQDMGWLRADDVPNVVTTGPLVVSVGGNATFTGTLVWSGYTGQAITYTWGTAEHAPIIHPSLSRSDSVTLSWAAPGEKAVTLTAVSASAVRAALVFVVDASGPVQGDTNHRYTFNADVMPTSLSFPVTYTWEATAQPIVVHPDKYTSDSVAYTWATPGAKTITVTTTIKGATAQAVHLIDLAGNVFDQFIFLPLVQRQ